MKAAVMLSCLPFTAFGATFHVDPGHPLASDSSPGSAERPWRTLARVNKARLSPGDEVRLACGAVFRETLYLSVEGRPGAKILIAAPADCHSPPRIEGVDPVDGSWVRTQRGAVYRNDGIEGTVRFVASRAGSRGELEPLIPARHPNVPMRTAAVAYLTIPPGTDGDRGLNRRMALMIDPETLAVPEAELIGATVHVRTRLWLVETRQIDDVERAGGLIRIVMSRALIYPADPGFGFVLEGKRWMLDHPGEWHLATGQLHVWPRSGAPPLTGDVVVGRRDQGLVIRNSEHLTVRNLAISGTRTGIAIDASSEIALEKLKIFHSYGRGVDVASSSGISLSDCTLEDSAGEAFHAVDSDAVLIERNQIRRTGVSPTLARSLGAVVVENGAMRAGLSIRPSRVANNLIEDSGYLAVRFGRRTTVEANDIRRACLMLEDCGAIYTYNAPWRGLPTESVVRANRIENVPGNRAGSPNAGSGVLVGIYLDNDTQKVAVENNHISGAAIGILLHNAFDNRVEGNVVCNSREAAIYLSETRQNSRQASQLVSGNLVAHNQLQLSDGSASIRRRSQLGATKDFGAFADNYCSSACNACTGASCSGATLCKLVD